MNHRKSGILFHISSLPNEYGIGTFGKSAYEFVDFLYKAKQSIWQVLPLVPAGFGGSPYQSYSSMAIDANFIDLDILIEKGLLTKEECEPLAKINGDRVDFKTLTPLKDEILRKAYSRFKKDEGFNNFMVFSELRNYAVFMTIKELNDNKCWYDWDKMKYFDEREVENFYENHQDRVEYYLWQQYEAYDQWIKVKKYANSKNVYIMGDMPIYVALDSVEVWSNPKYFQLDCNLNPTDVAGVPPDYFCEDGQLWGNPLYDWDEMRKDGYSWWNNRIDKAFNMFDIVRIDHFRAMDRYYSIKAGSKNAKEGKWKPSVGFDLFKDKLDRKIVAEDLGMIDDGVRALLRKTSFPGMKVMQYGMDGDIKNEHRPSNFPLRCVAYTGTHDNATLKQALSELSDKDGEMYIRSLKDDCTLFDIDCKIGNIDEVIDTTLAVIYASRARTVIIPLQDWLKEGKECRMNVPGLVSDLNWTYREKEIPHYLSEKIAEYTIRYNRLNKGKEFKKTKFDLGVNLTKDSTTFAVWSPKAKHVKVNIYDEWNDKDAIESYDMSLLDEVWSVKVEKSLKGKYYLYEVDNNLCIDPYARAVGINSTKAYIADLVETDPVAWEDDTYRGNQTPIVWEVHIRDFSIGRPIEFELRGKYKGFVVGYKTLKGNSCLVDYLKELGITYIQLLPVADFASVDERDFTQRNWGYDPRNFNALDGSYSANPYDPLKRIKEFKEIIKVLHDNNIGVIMDVVYNHTYTSANSNFEKVAPGSYYRKLEDGQFYNGSGCGNEIASERPMVRKFILDSVLYWAEEYHIDGFRFDLMGLMDVETVNLIRQELDDLEKRYKKKILTYGEPWWALPPAPWITPADMYHVGLINKKVGIFNPTFRNGLRGDNNLSKGFLQGMAVSLGAVMSGIEGGTKTRDKNDTVLRSANQNICYMSAHDNYTLYDQLNATMDNEEEILRATRFGSFYVESAVGMPFMLAGEEFCRTKHMNDNSYNADDFINALDWDRRDDYCDMVNYYAGLIAIRKHNVAYRDLDKAAKEFKWLPIEGKWGCLAYKVGNYIYIANPTDSIAGIELGEYGTLERLADIRQAGLNIMSTHTGRFTIGAKDVAILRIPEIGKINL